MQHAAAPLLPLWTDDVIRVRAFRARRIPWDARSRCFWRGSHRRGRDYSDYEFSADPSFVLMSEPLRAPHDVRIVNVTLPASCLGWASPPASSPRSWSFLVDVVGVDEVVVNQFMHGLDARRAMLPEPQHARDVELAVGARARDRARLARVAGNALAVWRAVLVVVLVSSVTALMVRVLVSSGVALMFPLLATSIAAWSTFQHCWRTGRCISGS